LKLSLGQFDHASRLRGDESLLKILGKLRWAFATRHAQEQKRQAQNSQGFRTIHECSSAAISRPKIILSSELPGSE
jgi:hypothetical protein